MHIFELLHAWHRSMDTTLRAFDVDGCFGCSSDDSNPSCHLNLRCGDEELDLVVWDSGEAELMRGNIAGVVHQAHFDNVRTPDEIAVVLSQLIEFVVLRPRL